MQTVIYVNSMVMWDFFQDFDEIMFKPKKKYQWQKNLPNSSLIPNQLVPFPTLHFIK